MSPASYPPQERPSMGVVLTLQGSGSGPGPPRGERQGERPGGIVADAERPNLAALLGCWKASEGGQDHLCPGD